MRARIRNLSRTPFATALAGLALITGIRGIVEPESFVLHLFLGSPVSMLWAGIYALGGFLMLHGMVWLKPKYEAAGCVLFGFATTAQAVATAVVVNRTPFLHWYGVVALALIAVMSFVRTRHLVKGEQLVWVIKNGDK